MLAQARAHVTVTLRQFLSGFLAKEPNGQQARLSEKFVPNCGAWRGAGVVKRKTIFAGSERRDRQIGIGGSLAASPLPHHRTYGSVSGDSVDYAGCCAATEAKPSALKNAIGMAMVSAGLFASRQGPCGLPAVCAARSRPTPQRRSSAKRVSPRFHCFQAMARNRRLSHWSSVSNTDGVWQKPK